MWTKQRTRQGDSLTSLARAYGVSIEKILLANGITPPAKHTARYLAQKSQEYQIPANLPRAAMSKLVMEYDIQRWVRSVGGDCEAPRPGSQAQIKHLIACAPGYYCRFTKDTAIELPVKKRLLGGLGAVSSVELGVQLASAKTDAKAAADQLVNSMSDWRVIDKPKAEAWRANFTGQVEQLVTAALKKDSSGRHNFERDPSMVTRIVNFVQQEIATAKTEFSPTAALVASLESALFKFSQVVAVLTDAPMPEDPSTPSTPAPTKTGPLAQVRAGKATLKRGAKGPAVEELQTLLRGVLPASAIPAGFKVDGDFGGRTETAVKNFQRANKMTANGVVNAAVMRVLDSGLVASSASVTSSSKGSGAQATLILTKFSLADVRAGKASFARGQRGPGIAEAAALLMAKAPVSTGTPVDAFGPQMEAAVRTAQEMAKLPVTGRMDQATVAALDKLPDLTALTTSSSKSNTLVYVGVGAVLLLLLAGGATAAKKRRSIAAV